jgi:CRP/FNR family transcriptional regulator, cyclic AMP receptor protein
MAAKDTKKSTAFDPVVFLETAAFGRTMSTYAKGDAIFSQGDPADAVFYIRMGKVKMSVLSPQGKEAVVGILASGEFIGEGCGLHPVPKTPS